MTLRQLEFFRAVAEEKSILRAAGKLNMAQPPVSRQIELLEEELNVKLFFRSNRGVQLTEAGEAFYKNLDRVFDSMNALKDSVSLPGMKVTGTVRIGILYSAVSQALERIERYHALYPAVELYLQLGTPAVLQELLEAGELDILFTRGNPDTNISGQVALEKDPLELIMIRETDPVPESATVPIRALEQRPLCLLRMNDLSGYNDHLLAECRKQGIQPNIVCQCYDTPMAMQMVQAGFGLSFLPRSILSTHPNSGIYSKPVQGISVLSHPVMLRNPLRYEPRAVQLFADSCR